MDLWLVYTLLLTMTRVPIDICHIPVYQRIEEWWSFLIKTVLLCGCLSSWIWLMKVILIWLIFSWRNACVLQIGLDEVKNNWNTHGIRKSRFETVSGRPDSLYTIPEFHGGIDGLIVPVQSVALDYAYFYDHLVEVS